MNRKIFLIIALAVMDLYLSGRASGHDAPMHVDPELLAGWRTWLHLTIQWSHLVAFGLWLGLIVVTLVLRLTPPLDILLYSSWVLFLVSLATGTYNMEWSAGISETPSILLLPLLSPIPYGVSYTIVLTVKLGFYILLLFWTLFITALHLKRQRDEGKLRKLFVLVGSFLGVAISLATAVVLFYHEAADLWPTPVHSLGGVVGPEGPRPQAGLNQKPSSPDGFWLLTTSAAWVDISVRWVHLLGFALWVGASAAALLFGPVPIARFLSISWAAISLQLLSGIAGMVRWAPFDVPPYFWNLDHLSRIRFGRSYALFMTAKHGLVLVAIALMTIWTVRYGKNRRRNTPETPVQSLAGASLCIGLVIGYIMMIILFLHEGVDHAL
ncbi:MAG: hypothetical protein HY695_19210 [Deltaproteobacteria bacterium]|nr:hypothetical protein [Deltaproteobacteria bacterium]